MLVVRFEKSESDLVVTDYTEVVFESSGVAFQKYFFPQSQASNKREAPEELDRKISIPNLDQLA